MDSQEASMAHSKIRERLFLALSIVSFVVICCVSSVGVSQFFRVYHVSYDPAALSQAAVWSGAFALVFVLFVFAEFSFGYFVGFYFAAMVLGYLWLSFFSVLDYDHHTARVSAAVSAVAFLLPPLFVSSPLPRMRAMPARLFDRLLQAIFLICLATVVFASAYNFRFVSPGDASNLRTDAFPAILNYLISITSISLLPFLFACTVARRNLWQAAAVLVLMLFYYPIAVSKTAFFAPAWLVVMWALSRFFGTRMAVVLSLLLPILAGVLLLPFFNHSSGPLPVALSYFFNVNFRILAVPSLAMDLYNDFFSKHDLTYFCQISILKSISGCPYREQLGVVMLKYFPGGGNYNASLFATEGIASVGTVLAPVSVFVCGLIIALGNRASSGLPPFFILVSSAILVQVLLNVPLSTGLLTYGGGFLFLLWYLTPREMFEQERWGE